MPIQRIKALSLDFYDGIGSAEDLQAALQATWDTIAALAQENAAMFREEDYAVWTSTACWGNRCSIPRT